MFLDPEPKGRQGRSRNTMSGLFSQQRPITDPLGSHNNTKRKPLHERSKSQNNQQKPGRHQHIPTVRLVTQSPSPSTTPSRRVHDDAEKENSAQARASSPESPTSRDMPLSASKPGISASGQDYGVSDKIYPTNYIPKLDLPPAITLIPKSSAHPVPKTAWHRRSTSSGNYSESSTLKDPNHSVVSFGQRSGRFSQGTTLRGTPPPFLDLEDLDRVPESLQKESAEDQRPTHLLHTLQEASPERSTTRAVSPALESQHDNEPQRDAGTSESSLELYNLPPFSPPQVPCTSSRRPSSVSSERKLRSQDTFQRFGLRQVARSQTSKETFAQSETAPQTSSPNLFAYDSDVTRPRSASYPLHAAISFDSIQSRLDRSADYRPQTQSLRTSSSQASFGHSSSTDTLPPLLVPKKRLRHKQGTQSLGSIASHGISVEPTSPVKARMVTQEEIDTLPWPRQPFSSHLSTIASESDRQSSQPMSQFSLGSGVLTGDDASSIPLSSTWRDKRGESMPLSIEEESSQYQASRSNHGSEEEPGDMTLGIFRAESAKPEPLFKLNNTGNEGKVYNGPRPPIPPIPKSRDSDERFDTISDLSAPPLRQQRSGYSLRRQSTSTPSQGHSRGVSQISYYESDRGSHASSIFPIWAKHFYSGTAGLLSASKISLSLPPNSKQQQAPTHARDDSQWTERSITSRLGTSYSELDSPTSSHFLPSIFRPRTRQMADTEGTANRQSYRFGQSRSQTRKPRPSGDRADRPDSMGIFSDPLPESRQGIETLPSGQPKWGSLKDKSQEPPLPPLPRKYSKQKLWNEMEYPRPMTKDRLSNFGIGQPHLTRSKRASQNRLSTWQAPSFVESLDTLVRSRCNRQILFLACGFVCPLLWMVAAVLPLPKKPISAHDLEKSLKATGSDEDVQTAMMRHEAGDAERRWREERQYLKARWWRCLNRIMSVIGVLIVGSMVSPLRRLAPYLTKNRANMLLQIALAVVAASR